MPIQRPKVDLIKNVTFFSFFNQKQASQLLSYLKFISGEHGKYISFPNNGGIWIILTGRVEIMDTASPKVVENGQAIGLLHFLLGLEKPAISKIKCLRKTEIIELSLNNFMSLKKTFPEIAELMMNEWKIILSKSISDNQSQKNFLTSLPRQFHNRTEKDLLGIRELQNLNYYGVQTLRALENFDISSEKLNHYPVFIKTFARVKKCAAKANLKLGLLDTKKAYAIIESCDEIAMGYFQDQFVVDMFQGGAGTSTNMNLNEVIANRALEKLGFEKGDFEIIHPNNDVNLCQSTNDVYPTAFQISLLQEIEHLRKKLSNFRVSLRKKSIRFRNSIKMGRTELQDAVPLFVGDEFEAWSVGIEIGLKNLTDVENELKEIFLGGTAIGTGIGAHKDFHKTVIKELRAEFEITFVTAKNFIYSTSSALVHARLSQAIKAIAIHFGKVAHDLRLLSSGPRCGFGDLILPECQPGSSIMPGKINPVIPEMMNQVVFQVIGNDHVITLACEAGQLQLNAFLPVVARNLFQSISLMSNTVEKLQKKCIENLHVNEEKCQKDVQKSIGVITALLPELGYEVCSELGKVALKENKSIRDVILSKKIMSQAQLEVLLEEKALVSPFASRTRKLKKSG